jgi:signal transduction histidine kinase
MQSLQARLATGLVVSLIVLFTLEWLIVRGSIQTLTDDYVASRLTHSTTGLLALVTFGSDGRPQLDTSRLEPLYHRPFSGHYFHLHTDHGYILRSRSLWDDDLKVSSVPTGESVRMHTTGPKGQRLLVLVSGFEKQGHAVTIAVAENLAPLAQELWQFEKRYVFASGIILVLLITIQAFIVRFGFVPLTRVRQDIKRLEEGKINQLGEAVPTEVRPLVREMNRLLRVMEQRLKRSRNALGNLAHALKTPLTLVMQLVEGEDMRAVPKVRDQLIEHTAILRKTLERELRRARLAGAVASRQRLLLSEEIPLLVSVLHSIYQDKSLDIACRISPQAAFVGDREDILELLGNLLDNACQWAHQRVLLTIEEQPDLTLVIEDDGPGCAPEVLQHLAQRGVRVDESAQGHGLGLAIVKDIVDQYGGDIRFGRSIQLGGFQVCVTFVRHTANKGWNSDDHGHHSTS